MKIKKRIDEKYKFLVNDNNQLHLKKIELLLINLVTSTN